MADNKQPVANRTEPVKQPLAIPQEWGVPNAGGGYLTSVDDSTPEGKLQIYQLLTGKGDDIRTKLNSDLELTGYLLSPAEFQDKETGEQVQTVVTRLLLSDGSFVETHSHGVLKTLGMLCQLFGRPPWKSPVIVRPLQQQLQGGRSWFILKLIGVPKLPGQREKAQKPVS